MVAFWGCEVTETHEVVVEIPEGFVLNVCNATCDASNTESLVALGLETQQLDDKMWKGVVAHLGAKQPLMVKLDLVFGHKVKFYLAKGSGVVNVTGYFQPGPSADLSKEKAGEKAVTGPKKNTKRARKETKTEKNTNEVSTASSSTEKPSKKKAKPGKVEPTKEKSAESPETTSENSAAPVDPSQKKKRKKKQKKPAAEDETN